jgi:hypothetical protein
MIDCQIKLQQDFEEHNKIILKLIRVDKRVEAVRIILKRRGNLPQQMLGGNLMSYKQRRG